MQSASHESSFAPHPLAVLVAALATGILIEHFYVIHLALLLSFAAVASALALWLLRKRKTAWPLFFIILATVFAGATLEVIEKRKPPENQIKSLFERNVISAGDSVELTGVLEQPPENTPDSFYLTIRVEKLRLKGIEHAASGVVQLLAPVHGDSVRAEYDALELHYGARVRVMVSLERTDNYRNPGVSSFTEFLDRNG
jgi:predicted membrane metal-binding protein